MKTETLKLWKTDQDRDLMQELPGGKHRVIVAEVDRNELVQLGHAIADALGMEMRVPKNAPTPMCTTIAQIEALAERKSA